MHYVAGPKPSAWRVPLHKFALVLSALFAGPLAAPATARDIDPLPTTRDYIHYDRIVPADRPPEGGGEIDLSPVEGRPVAIDQTAYGIFFVDYVSIYVIKNRKTYAVTVDNPKGYKLNPTDISVDGDIIYIANYTANNVLVGRISEDGRKISIERAIGDKQTISPEGVSAQGGLVAVANYDGHSVQVFAASAGENEAATCTVPVGWGHGVTFANGVVFATSLRDRMVHRIDPKSCRIVASAGGVGWGVGQYLWPTSIAQMDNNRLIVSDAHTGRLTILSVDDLRVVDAWGKNGPKAFNMPYGVSWSKDAVWVASTSSRSLVELPELSWEKARFHRYAKDAWSWKAGSFPASAYPSGDTWSGYDLKTDVLIRGACHRLSYGAVKRCDGGADAGVVIPPVLRGSHVYFTQAVRAAGGTLVSSPQNLFGLYFPDGGGAPVEVEIGLDTWAVDGQLVGPYGPVRLIEIPAAAKQN